MRRVEAGAQRGKCHALNIGIAAARGAGILFCDADDTAAPGWLAAMAGALRQHDFVAARMNTRRLNPGWIQTYRQGEDTVGLRRLGCAPYCSIAGGGQIGFRRTLFDDVGPFDPAFAVQEDHDYCVRAHLKGYRLHLVPEAVFNYRFRSDPGAIFRQAHSYARHRALLRRRYDPQSPIAPLAWARLGLRIARLTGGRMVRVALARPSGDLDRARFNRRLGGLLGDAAGALAYGVAPSNPAARRVDAAE